MVSMLWLTLLATPVLREPGPLSPRIVAYQIQVELDAAGRALSGHETLDWRNDGGAPTDELWLHLYWNAFQNDATRLLRPPEHGGLGDPIDAGGWGYIDVAKLRCAGRELALEPREDGTIARVVLPRAVAPGETLRCELDFSARVPKLTARAGYAADFFAITQWFPKLGVWDGRQWKCHVYCASCEFFADFGVYDVAITVPDQFVVGATGALTAQQHNGGKRTDTYHAEDVHDFGFVAASGLLERRADLDGDAGRPPVAVRLLYPREHEWFAAEHLRLIAATLGDYGAWFGSYPYATLTVVDTPGDATEAAMEYPTFIFTESPRGRFGLVGYPQYVTIHELGHNWFYGLLASNEAEEPWLDEGLNQYVSDLVLERAGRRWYWPRGLPFALERWSWLAAGPRWAHFGKASWDYPTARAYTGGAYEHTTTLLASLERRFGRERLLGALGLYARRYRFRHPSFAGFAAALSEGLQTDVQALLAQAAAGAGWDDEVLAVSAEPPDRQGLIESAVFVHHKGTLSHPADLWVEFADGSSAAEVWTGEERWHRYRYRRAAAVVRAMVDPAHAWWIDEDLLNNGFSRVGSRAPAVRVASGLGFWVQSLMQLVGF
jgi:hypothetical protein